MGDGVWLIFFLMGIEEGSRGVLVRRGIVFFRLGGVMTIMGREGIIKPQFM